MGKGRGIQERDLVPFAGLDEWTEDVISAGLELSRPAPSGEWTVPLVLAEREAVEIEFHQIRPEQRLAFIAATTDGTLTPEHGAPGRYRIYAQFRPGESPFAGSFGRGPGNHAYMARVYLWDAGGERHQIDGH